MTDHLHLSDDDLVLHYYGEEVPRADTHLAACAACQSNLAKLQRVMAFIDSAPAADAPEGFERIAWARLEPALAVPQRGWASWFVLSPGRLGFAAAVVLLVGASFMAGRLMPRPGPATVASTSGQTPAEVRERILLSDLGEHLDRSQRMLVELASVDNTAGAVDIAPEQMRAEQLVAANRLYRQTATSTGDAAIAALLDDLERVLVDIAASPATMSQEDLDAVRRRIDSKELLFKVRVTASQVRARQREAISVRSAHSTVGS